MFNPENRYPTPSDPRWPLVDSDCGSRGGAAERTHPADAVPRIPLVRRLPLAFIALEKPRHEEFFRQRCQLHAAGLTVVDDLAGLVEVDDLDHRPRLGRI